MKMLQILFNISCCLVVSCNISAQCQYPVLLQPDGNLPVKLTGRLVYHSYTRYGDGSSNLFLKDFLTRELTQLNQPEWHIVDPMNAHFSPNGRWLAFMGRQNGRWNIFLWKTDSTLPPVNLSNHTDKTGGASEDPKFSADGNYLVYKYNSDIVLAHLNFGNPDVPYIDNVWKLTNNGISEEESMPYLSKDNKNVFYSQGSRGHSDLYRVGIKIDKNNVIVSAASLAAGKQGLAEFYPVPYGVGLLFVGWRDATQKDHIYLGNTKNNQADELPLNDCVSDNSDPVVVDKVHIIFSSTTNSNTYNLFLGHMRTGHIWSLDQFGVNQASKNQLGATYTQVR